MLLTASVASLVALGIELYVWTVAYPNFERVGRAEFLGVHAFHAERITYSIGPALIVAACANAAVAVVRPRGVPGWLPLAAVAAGIFVLGYTAFIQVPIHARLSHLGYDRPTIEQLNANEPARAFATFAQAACDVAMLAIVLRR